MTQVLPFSMRCLATCLMVTCINGCATNPGFRYDKPGGSAHAFRMDNILCRMEPGYGDLSTAERWVSMDKCLQGFGWIRVNP